MSSSWWDPFGLFGDTSSEKLSKQQWNWYKTKYEQSREDQLFYADESLALQKEQLRYQEALNNMQMEREDDAVRRRIADLKAAGLSPTLAAGSAADTGALRSGSVSQVSGPHMSPATDNPRIQVAMFKEQMQRDSIALASTVLGNVADISRTKAEAELLKAQTDKLVGETPIDLKLKEMEQVLKESTLGYEVTLKAQQTDLNELRKINDELTGKILSNEVAIKAYEVQIKEHESKIKDIEAKYAEREHKAGLGKTEAERDKLVQEVKEKAIAVEMAEFLRDNVKDSGVPLEMMSPAFKNFYSFKSYGAKQASEPVPNGVPFKDTSAGRFLKKIFVKSPGLSALKAAAQSR